jgi:hypothetical protein
VLVEAKEGQHPVRVRLEAALLPERLQDRAGPLQVSGELGDPGVRQHGQLEQRAIAPAGLARQALALGAGLLWPPRQEEAEGGLQLQVLQGLAARRELAQGDELVRAALGVLGQVQDRAQGHQPHFIMRGAGVELRPAGDRLRDLAADVLDLGEEVQRSEIVWALLQEGAGFPLCLLSGGRSPSSDNAARPAMNPS